MTVAIGPSCRTRMSVMRSTSTISGRRLLRGRRSGAQSLARWHAEAGARGGERSTHEGHVRLRKDDAEPWARHDSASSHGVPGRYRYCPVGTACTGFGFSSLRASVVSTLTYTMRSPLRPAIFAQSSGLLVFG